MKLIRDLLLFDIQTTGQDPDRDAIIQLAAVLLDKDNLLEKQFFNSYVRVSLLDSTLLNHSAMLGIAFKELRASPKAADVFKHFHDTFGAQVILSCHYLANAFFLKNAYKKYLIPFEFDYHILDIWTLGYVYLLSFGLKKMPTFNSLLDHFGLKLSHPQNALERVRLEAEVLRRIITHA